MAQKVNILLVDDLDGSEATQTVTFGLDGTTYEIDLNDKHAEKMRKALADFVGAARKVTGSRGSKGRSSSTAAASQEKDYKPSEVREWAEANGHEVPARGRIPADVLDAYRKAH